MIGAESLPDALPEVVGTFVVFGDPDGIDAGLSLVMASVVMVPEPVDIGGVHTPADVVVFTGTACSRQHH